MRDPRMIQRSAIGIGVAAIIAALCLAAIAADSSRTEKIPAAIDAAHYADFMESEALDLVDLAEGAEIQRRMFNRMTPPGFSWLQPMFPSVVTFDAADFEEIFLADLLGEDRNSVAVYPLSLALDPKTRETLVYNADGKLIATVPADGISRTWPEDADPARVTLQLDLLPSEDVEPYLYVEDRIAKSIASGIAKSAKTGGVTLKGLGAGEFGFSADWSLTNGTIRLTVTNGADAAEIYSYTVLHTSTVVVTTWTNDEDEVITETNTLWTPVSPSFDGIESGWECQTTNLILTNGIGVWEDANISSNPCMRFYAAAQRVDTDADGLTDGAEILLHRTDPGNSDTDRDGWSDAEELTEETDPLDRFSATRLARGVMIRALCYNPSNGPASSNQWVQLHSTAASVVDLSDFRLQVAGSNYATRVTFPSNTWIHPGHFILLGGSDVTNGDSHAELGLPNSFPTNPTAGVRLVGPDGVAADPVDVVMYGTHAPFNEGNLPTNGWGSTNTDLWAGTGYQLVREMFGLDTDMRVDWQYDQVGELWNQNTVLDSDGDGLTDEEEYSGSAANGVPSDPLDPDTDDDGLQDGFEADHDLSPANPDTNGNAVPDADEINPDTGHTYLEDQLGTDVSVSVKAFLPGWILGQSIGSNGWVTFTLEDWDGVGVWATINEGGFVPEAFTYSVENAVVAFTTNIYHGGFRTVQLLLISTNTDVPMEVTINDGGTYWTNQIPINYGPDIFAHFDAVKVTLDALAFSGTNYHNVISDDGLTVYSAPQWITPREGEEGHSYPLCYTRGNKMSVLGGWDITPAGLPFNLSVQIQGVASGGMEFPLTPLTRQSDIRWSSPVMECSNAFDDVVALFDPMQIDWSILLDSCEMPLDAGVSTNQCYVTLYDPLNPDLRHTLLHLGCKNAAGKSTEPACTEEIWNEFTDRNVCRIDGTPMTYYQDYRCTNDSTDSLLINGDGACGAWANLFIDILKAQGINYVNELARITPLLNYDAFAFKNWSFSEPGNSGNMEFPYLIIPEENWKGATNYNWKYSDMTDLQGLPGQANSNPASIFGEHFVCINNQYYDPSSGVKYDNLAALDSNSIDGFLKYESLYPVNEQVVNIDLDGSDQIENTNVYVEVLLFQKNPPGTDISVSYSDK